MHRAKKKKKNQQKIKAYESHAWLWKSAENLVTDNKNESINDALILLLTLLHILFLERYIFGAFSSRLLH